MDLRGESPSSFLLRLPSDLRCDVRLLRTSTYSLTKGGSIIPFNIDEEIQKKPDHDMATSYFSHISPSTLWISVDFGVYGKVLSRRIQRRRLQEVWRRTRRGRRKLLGDERLSMDKEYWCLPISASGSLGFLLTRQAFSLNSQSFLAGFGVF